MLLFGCCIAAADESADFSRGHNSTCIFNDRSKIRGAMRPELLVLDVNWSLPDFVSSNHFAKESVESESENC